MSMCHAEIELPLGTLECTLTKGHAGDHQCITASKHPDDGSTQHAWTGEIDDLSKDR